VYFFGSYYIGLIAVWAGWKISYCILRLLLGKIQNYRRVCQTTGQRETCQCIRK